MKEAQWKPYGPGETVQVLLFTEQYVGVVGARYY
jgi:hypothetical protein